jgi:DeoR family fructose operon transcriptional repressor
MPPSEPLVPAERRNRILNIMADQHSVRVADLSQRLGVSEVTIRRDLDLLEHKGIVERSHGGAILRQRMRVEPLFSDKERAHPEEKLAIGRAAAELVRPGETVFVNSGSTTLQVLRHLGGKRLRVITSNAGAIDALQGSDADVILLGGTYRQQSHSLVGPLALLSLQRIYASKCFIGVDGVSIKCGLTTPSLEEAEVARSMIEHTHGEVIVVADHTKLGTVADSVTVELERVDTIVVDDAVTDGYRDDLETAGIRVVIAALE